MEQPNGRHDKNPAGRGGSSKRPGRPPGSVSLTPEIHRTIVNLIQTGTFAHVAAQVAGIAPRTFDDWMARGEGRHPSRSPTPKLRAFAKDVRRAQAVARAVAEGRVFKERPQHWLAYVARSKPGLEGWSVPRKGGDEDRPRVPTLEERLAELGDSPSD